MTRRAGRAVRIALSLALITALILAAVLTYLFRPKAPPRLTLAPASYNQLVGWRDDRIASAIPTLRRSCAGFLAKSDDAALDALTKGIDFGRVGEWRAPCAAAAALPANDDEAARQFFETAFVPFLAGNNGESKGLFPG